MTEERFKWEPIVNGEYAMPPALVIVDDDNLFMADGSVVSGSLPDDVRLCRRAPAQSESLVVPYDVGEVIRLALRFAWEEVISQQDAERALDWLDDHSREEQTA